MSSDLPGAAPVLFVLAIGQVVNILLPTQDMMLSMTGHGAILRRLNLQQLVVCCALSGVLVPFFGMLGAAIVRRFPWFRAASASRWRCGACCRNFPSPFGKHGEQIGFVSGMIIHGLDGLDGADHDICVVGAGPVGISLALELAERGRSVVLLKFGRHGRDRGGPAPVGCRYHRPTCACPDGDRGPAQPGRHVQSLGRALRPSRPGRFRATSG